MVGFVDGVSKLFKYLSFRKRRHKMTAIICAFICCMFVFRHMYVSFYTVNLPPSVDENQFLPFEPEVKDDFPTANREIPIIPHIIHQTYRTEEIPRYYAEFAKSFVDKNPTWDYYFWTDETARLLLVDKYPDLLPVWDTYSDPINRADALRYVVLYEYGGVYADLDYECIRSLDRVTYKHSCIMPTEPFEQVVFRLELPYLINNAIMLVRPKHPFFKQIIDNLMFYQMMDTNTDKAGPMFVTSQYLSYNKFTPSDYVRITRDSDGWSPYLFKGTLPDDHEDAIYVPNTRYFMDTLDEHAFKETRYYWKCNYFDQLSDLQKRACIALKQKGFHRQQNYFAFAKHHWFQAHNPLKVFFKHYFGWLVPTRRVHISDIVPKYKTYGKDFK